ncbi:MAG: NUDIX domain-containing protein [Acidimicrobiales bacterium]|nr:NUDIX domain-containing protein [Acidimicrobiales bacterium]
MPKMSAGLLAYKMPAQDRLEVLLVHPGGPFWKNKDSHAWSVPKGEYRNGDEPEREADREFTEELGQPAPKGPRLELGSVHQSGGKWVRVWAVEVDDISVEDIQSNSFEMEWPPKSGRNVRFPEVDRAEWMTIPQARDRLVKGQVEFLDRLLDALDRRA